MKVKNDTGQEIRVVARHVLSAEHEKTCCMEVRHWEPISLNPGDTIECSGAGDFEFTIKHAGGFSDE